MIDGWGVFWIIVTVISFLALLLSLTLNRIAEWRAQEEVVIRMSQYRNFNKIIHSDQGQTNDGV